jgi:RNA polymerase sigma factor (sigma-70 family)
MFAAAIATFSWLAVFSKSEEAEPVTTNTVLVPAGSPLEGSGGPVDVPDFATIYDRHFAFVWRLAANSHVPSAHLDDVVQETFLVIHRKLPTFEGRASLRTWIAAITRNTAREFLRRKRNQILGNDVDPDASASDSMTPADRLEAVGAAKLPRCPACVSRRGPPRMCPQQLRLRPRPHQRTARRGVGDVPK